MINKVAKKLYTLEGYELSLIPGHEGGRNHIYICRGNDERKLILRVSALEDRTIDDYLAEVEFVHFLALNGAPVIDVIPSVNDRLVEQINDEGKRIFVSLFSYAKGMLMHENGYRYREGASIDEYFYNTGKALGAIHRHSKNYEPVHRRQDFFNKYSMDYIDGLIPDQYAELKKAISRRLELYRTLPIDKESYGLVHFDYSDGNYHVDMNNGDITVFDFDNCIYCWYMFDLAHVWTHGVGWYQHIHDPEKRMEGMKHYFDVVLDGYRSETDISDDMLEKLPLFIDMTIIENVVDEFECAIRECEKPDDENIEDLVNCLVNDIPYAGFLEN